MKHKMMMRAALPLSATLMLLVGLVLAPSGEAKQCPQPRFTEKAPDEIYNMQNPLKATDENLKKGRMLFQVKAKPMACKHCHGAEGDGTGPMARGFDPLPRDFTCTATINGVPDGQLFWIIKNGSPGTGMLAFGGLQDDEIWQIVLYIRELAK